MNIWFVASLARGLVHLACEGAVIDDGLLGTSGAQVRGLNG